MSARTGARAKAYGAFYTDTLIADFLVRWAVREPKDTVMDPSFGGGVFLEAAAKRIKSLGGNSSEQVFGVELDSEVHKRVSGELQLVHNVNPDHLIQADLFELEPNHLQMDAVVGNPPFIRYQSFAGRARGRALARSAAQGVSLNKLASSWAAFVVHSTAFVKPGGRLAMVIPMELGHAAYARPVLDYLTRSFGAVTLLTFKKRLFADLSQDTLLLLAAGRAERFVGLFWQDMDSLRELPHVQREQLEPNQLTKLDMEPFISGQDRLILHFISPAERNLYRRLSKHPQVTRLGDLASVGIGYVSGANSFFHLSPADVKTWNIPRRYLRRAVFRGKALGGLKFDLSDWQRAAERGEAGYLLTVASGKLPKAVQRYLEHGEAQGVHRAYKCRVRSPWYHVPHVHESDALLTYMSGLRPQLVANDAAAVTPNTLHAVHFKDAANLSGDTLAALWQTSLTALSVELEGHALGGGMLKLEPSEARRVLIPCPVVTQGLIDKLDTLLRQNKEEEARALANKVILQDALELSCKDIDTLNKAARSLQIRRYYRGESNNCLTPKLGL